MSFGHVENTAWLERIYISGSKSNQAMELGQLIDYNKRNIFFQKLCRNWGRETIVADLFLIFKYAWYQVKASGLQLSFKIFRTLNLGCNKNKPLLR